MNLLTDFAIRYPRWTFVLATIVTAFLGWQFRSITIDTDPENMLERTQPDRVVYDAVKEDFGIKDLIVVGVVDEGGVFRPDPLRRVARLTDRIAAIPGVIVDDMVSLTTTDDITVEDGLLHIGPVMPEAPESMEEAEAIGRRIAANPLLAEKLASSDGTAIAIYIPIEQKDQSYRISREIERLAEEELGPGQRLYMAGLPVAEDTFGHEMFREMGVTAPLVGLVIFLLLWVLFRRVTLIVPAMVVAMFSVIWAMGALIGLGYTVHIMSSMIPVFLMPIAVLDAVHVLSEFYDRYPAVRDRAATLQATMDELFRPMLYTSITTSVGFASLALADIPPVRVFGVFVAVGILAAWVLTISVIPAGIMLVGEKRLANLGPGEKRSMGAWPRWLERFGATVFRRAELVTAGTVVLLGIGVIGVSRIVVNDNPVRWFRAGEPVRVADRVMNRLFGGTYMAYLVAEGEGEEPIKDPVAMAYLDRLARHLEVQPQVGKVTSIADVVRRTNYLLRGGDPEYDAVPNERDAIGQYLFLVQSSGDPNELDNFIDYDARQANLWVQMKSGDNRDMEAVTTSAREFTEASTAGLTLRWSGLTYINKVWQDLMVVGMLRAVLGSFVVVLLLMILLFRSIPLGFVSMVPLTLAILLSYALVGFIGKDYDMPIAVCSSLSLGLAIDFAIHFVHRYRGRVSETADLKRANQAVFGLPARAITRNAVVIIIGFLPLMVSRLTPYVTVGLFFATLMIFSALATLVVLPALMRLTGGRLFTSELALTATEVAV
ncbi:MAG: MMPL family transporter [Gemmatimonadales bacterium]